MHSMYSTIDGLFLSLHQIVTLNKSKHAHTDVYMCSFRPISFVAMLPEICKVLQSCLHMCTHKHEDAWRHVKHANGCSICMWLFGLFPWSRTSSFCWRTGWGCKSPLQGNCMFMHTHSLIWGRSRKSHLHFVAEKKSGFNSFLSDLCTNMRKGKHV